MAIAVVSPNKKQQKHSHSKFGLAMMSASHSISAPPSRAPNDANTGGSVVRKKRPAEETPPSVTNGPDTEGPPTKKIHTEAPVLDVCKTLGLIPGDRLEVYLPAKAEEHQSNKAETSSAAPSADADTHTPLTMKIATNLEFHWIPATLLAPDGRTHTLTDNNGEFSENNVKKAADEVVLAIHTLEVDRFPEAGYRKGAVRDICFLDESDTFDPINESFTHWRREGSSWEPTSASPYNIDSLEEMSVQDFITADEFEALSVEQKKDAGRVFVEITAKLREKLEKEGKSNVSEEDMNQVRDQVFSDLDRRADERIQNGPHFDSEGNLEFAYKNRDQAREQLQTILDGILGATLAKVKGMMWSLPAAHQVAVAEKVANSKERMLERLLQEIVEAGPGYVFTSDRMNELLAEVFG
uniref:Uncharacterized protein n=1 Tax=Odontella aurita TaxID=265563 RepID=A0A7S4JZI0_9STRA|mmetsp:Transcript_57924/g.172881  ORF Transcript_57924/g.172881 Transcript_57924/m.172881 type:complete len:411 (+) Transcript_57924:33-1265(+)